MRKSKAQVSVEFLMITGFVLVILIPLSVIYYEHLNTMTSEVKGTQLSQLAKDITSKAEEVYYLGPPSKVTINAYIPSGVEEADIYPHEINFKLRTSAGLNDIFSTSKVNLTGSINPSEGVHKITIEAKEGYVLVTG